MSTLIAGANAPVPQQTLLIKVKAQVAADVSAFRLYADGKVKGDLDMIFYGQKSSDDATLSLKREGQETEFEVQLPRLQSEVEKIAFTVTCDAGKTVQSLGELSISVWQQSTEVLNAEVALGERSEAALILGELYKRNDQWKFRFISQGFNGGLQPLAEHFGVEIAKPEPELKPALTTPVSAQTSAPASPPSASPTPASPSSQGASSTLNLSKISLTKQSPRLSLQKRDDYGLIKVNLNWNRDGDSDGKKTGFLAGLLGGGGVDLDLGAFVRPKNGSPDVIQALGDRFGSLDQAPYVQLLGDDRSGQAQDGEWLHINGKNWSSIDEILIFALIYQGVPDWSKTDGMVTLHVPNEPPVETRLTEGDKQNRLCAIARLTNQGNTLNVERLERYFPEQEALDKAFGWGFQWRAGRK